MIIKALRERSVDPAGEAAPGEEREAE
jgi:hypothetical protein